MILLSRHPLVVGLRKHNFSAGPGELPAVVLEEASEAVCALPGLGLSILGLSHRSDAFAAMVAEAEANLRVLLGVGHEYAVLFLQGGATLQFSMIPVHFERPERRPAEYLTCGYWSEKAVAEARAVTPVIESWNGRADGYRRVPRPGELTLDPDAAYLHYVSNETVEGLQFHDVPGLPSVPRVVDMSSDFLSRPHDIASHHLVYAHAQKNFGPAGVTAVIVRREVVDAGPRDLPAMLQYRSHADHRSMYNTPPVFAIYVTLLVTRWLLRDVGGLAAMERMNRRKAALVYALLDDAPDFFSVHAGPDSRSLMNIAFRTPTAVLDRALVDEAERAGLHGLAGHRSLGGLRVSLYNAVSVDSVGILCEFLDDFRRRHRG